MTKGNSSQSFDAKDTLSHLWNKNNPHLTMDTDNPHTISFLYAKTEELPKGVDEPVVTFPFFAENVKLLKDNYSVKNRVKKLKLFYVITAIALGIASLLLSLTQGINGFLGTLPTVLLVFGSIAVVGFIIFLARLKVDKYTDDMQSPEGKKTFTPITLHRDFNIPQPQYYSGNSINNFRTRVFFGGKHNHAVLVDAELYDTVKSYIVIEKEAEGHTGKDSESVSLFSDLAQFIVKYQKYVESRMTVQNNACAEEELSSDFLQAEDSLENSRVELIKKFKTASDKHNKADQERIISKVKSLLV